MAINRNILKTTNNDYLGSYCGVL